MRLTRLLVSSLLLTAAAHPAFAAFTVILVRHAERAAQPANDPPLSSVGEARARSLAAVLRDTPVTAIFVSDTQRTRQTAMPLARAKKLQPKIIAGGDPAATAREIRRMRNGTALVVGHSNTLPSIVTRLGGPAIGIADDDFDDLFILNIDGSRTSLVHLRYGDHKEAEVQIDFERSGGFAGLPNQPRGLIHIGGAQAQVTGPGGYTRRLGDDEAALIRSAAQSAPSSSIDPASELLRDGYQYRATIVSGPETRSRTAYGEKSGGELFDWIRAECRRIQEFLSISANRR